MSDVTFSPEQLSKGGQAPLNDLSRTAVEIGGEGQPWKKGGVTILLITPVGAEYRVGASQLFNAIVNQGLDGIVSGSISEGITFTGGASFEIEASNWNVNVFALGSNTEVKPADLDKDLDDMGKDDFETKYKMSKADARAKWN